MDLGLKGRTVLVLGAGGGLGRAIASSFAAEGANLALADVDASALEETAAAVRAHGVPACALAWDLADADALEGHIAQVEAQLGPVDVLINNTGGPPPTPAHGQSPALWQKSFEAMVLSVIRITDRVLPGMRARGWGRIVTSTSSGVVAPIANLGISNALRLSLVGWSKTLAREVAADGVTANIVLPGRIATPRIGFLDQAKAEREGRPVADVTAESTASIPMKRYGTPQEYAQGVVFLASDAASYITGTVLRIDGGLIASV
ncbi:SDR family oxidoreductase [Xylophilus sp.]|uniref:SDR family oxidoreductase n=1 Tax=Xylophilus sp. TaxID=2653893 RepID=UPI0013BAC8D0|nr:SDR family oxidoreductase [Xylophilus sp.]KAF1048569.1 MAG: 3-oxoacyl-[acyl-carrier-protein] reductase FabG [Xylophilus sp.]